MADIVEKLKDACVIDRHYGKSVTLTLDYDDYMEAADTITALRAENERLSTYAKRAAMDVLLCKDGNILLHEENERLRAALEDARECVQAWSAYANEYFREKHDLAGDLTRIDAALEGK